MNKLGAMNLFVDLMLLEEGGGGVGEEGELKKALGITTKI
jgi:hypothetical protein